MAKATFVKAARKDYPDAGIKKGESYYWWAFMSGGRGGARRFSKTPPRPSQLTQSEFWGAVLGIQEGADDNNPEYDDLESAIEDLKGELETVRDETQGKFDNLPDSLQGGQSGELLQARADALEECIDALENVDVSFDDVPEDPATGEPFAEDSDGYKEAKQERAEELWGEVREALGNISCE